MAVRLKEEGNAFFVQKDFTRAYKKYTEAIAIDGQNAVLYANRSACSFGMGRYLGAVYDARRATQINPGYAKGWSRLATAHSALFEFTSATRAWEKALDALSKDNLTPAELSQKEQYTASLERIRQPVDAVPVELFPGIANTAAEKPPWQVAEEMIPELQAIGCAACSSSAYMIHFANQEFVHGVGQMKNLKKMGDPDDYLIFGYTEVLAFITNGLMRDRRVFRMDRQDWVDKLNNQVHFEAAKHRAWILDDVESVKEKALERLKKEGWDGVRPALSIVVRGWIMRAKFDSDLRKAPQAAVERLKGTLELLHWGRQVWRDVSKDDRGVIFLDTFVVGVRALYLDILTRAYEKSNGSDKEALLHALIQEARELLQDVQRIPLHPAPSEPVDAGFISSFYVYPAAYAYATSGYCLVQLARSCKDPTDKKAHCLSAVKQYAQAAGVVPEDDELHCWYLQCSIDPMLQSDVPKDVIEGVVKRIRAAMPKMQRIWAHSALAKQGRDAMIETALRIAESK